MHKSFRDLVAFKLAFQVAVQVYRATAAFPKAELYGLTSQLRRAAVGVISNIAEGSGRLTYGEFRQFVSQARGSLFELEAQLLIAQAIGYVRDDELDEIERLIARCGSALLGLAAWLRERERAGNRRDFPPRDPVTS